MFWIREAVITLPSVSTFHIHFNSTNLKNCFNFLTKWKFRKKNLEMKKILSKNMEKEVIVSSRAFFLIQISNFNNSHIWRCWMNFEQIEEKKRWSFLLIEANWRKSLSCLLNKLTYGACFFSSSIYFIFLEISIYLFIHEICNGFRLVNYEI